MWTRRRASGLLVLVLAVPLAVGLLRPPRTENPPRDPREGFVARMDPPADVAAWLKRSCYDCHSHETRWPWYTRLSPAGWLMENHVREGRQHLNFSRWSDYTEAAARHKLEEAVEEVRRGRMPPRSYRWLHPEARVEPPEARRFQEWVAEREAGPS